MTPVEKDRIESAIRHIKTAADVDEWAMELAVQALKKQLPKEPLYVEEDIFAKNRFVELPHCPTCNWEIATGDMYCIMCGQAIDWSEDK